MLTRSKARQSAEEASSSSSVPPSPVVPSASHPASPSKSLQQPELRSIEPEGDVHRMVTRQAAKLAHSEEASSHSEQQPVKTSVASAARADSARREKPHRRDAERLVELELAPIASDAVSPLPSRQQQPSARSDSSSSCSSSEDETEEDNEVADRDSRTKSSHHRSAPVASIIQTRSRARQGEQEQPLPSLPDLIGRKKRRVEGGSMPLNGTATERGASNSEASNPPRDDQAEDRKDSEVASATEDDSNGQSPSQGAPPPKKRLRASCAAVVMPSALSILEREQIPLQKNVAPRLHRTPTSFNSRFALAAERAAPALARELVALELFRCLMHCAPRQDAEEDITKMESVADALP